ncbi:MAG TPA: Sir2 family NAD-dependent protein deacetylase [Steroidobacteraceae bacterium]|nr:Sir2 family NAD-dependent protein deacetylase [Steroidobacteraceae bacterium]
MSIATLRDLLNASQRAVVFSGAGISTESGIPDFRSPGGVWTKMQPIYFQDFVSSEEVRKEAWRRRFSNTDGWNNAKPNRGHLAVAKLVERGTVASVITQNVDNLHQISGVSDEKVIELHGNATYAKCLRCLARVELSVLEEEFTEHGTVKPCKCGGIIKSATISFGQSMPEAQMRRAAVETELCDLFIVLGSSLTVFPAADFPMHAKRRGARLVIVNRDPTDIDEHADLVIHDGIGDTLTAALGAH